MTMANITIEQLLCEARLRDDRYVMRVCERALCDPSALIGAHTAAEIALAEAQTPEYAHVLGAS